MQESTISVNVGHFGTIAGMKESGLHLLPSWIVMYAITIAKCCSDLPGIAKTARLPIPICCTLVNEMVSIGPCGI